jgi:hypothetical protein
MKAFVACVFALVSFRFIQIGRKLSSFNEIDLCHDFQEKSKRDFGASFVAQQFELFRLDNQA